MVRTDTSSLADNSPAVIPRCSISMYNISNNLLFFIFPSRLSLQPSCCLFPQKEYSLPGKKISPGCVTCPKAVCFHVNSITQP